MAAEEISKEEHEEGKHTDPPEGEDHGDTEPDDDVIPHSAKAMADYHDGLKDLTEAAEKHHGEFLKEMKKHYGAMEHMTIRKHMGNWLEDHEKSLKEMTDCHKALCEDMEKKFSRHHPDLEPLTKDMDEEEDVPTATDKDKEPRKERPEDREEAEGHGDKKLPVVAATPPVGTKTTPPNPDELSEDDALTVLHFLSGIKKDAKELRQEFARSIG